MKRTFLIAVLITLAAVLVPAQPGGAMYHPQTGRWLQREPTAEDQFDAGYADGMSLCQYVRSNPVAGRDSMGLETEGRSGDIRRPRGPGGTGDIFSGDKECQFCGPDITDALQRMMANINVTFRGWSFREKLRRCFGRFSGAGWDTDLFTRPGVFTTPGCPTGNCGVLDNRRGLGGGVTVTVAGHCYDSFDVNYVLWGRMNSLCSPVIPRALGWLSVIAWKHFSYGGLRTQQAMEWTGVGELGVVVAPPTTTARPCTPCVHQKWPGVIGWVVSRTAPGWWPGWLPWF